jgi:selenocysteine lyase/cysteine desulfurase
VVSFTVRGLSPADAEGALGASFGIAARSGLHCAPGAHRLMGTLESGGTVRISPGPFSTDADIDGVIGALKELLGALG